MRINEKMRRDYWVCKKCGGTTVRRLPTSESYNIPKCLQCNIDYEPSTESNVKSRWEDYK